MLSPETDSAMPVRPPNLIVPAKESDRGDTGVARRQDVSLHTIPKVPDGKRTIEVATGDVSIL